MRTGPFPRGAGRGRDGDRRERGERGHEPGGSAGRRDKAERRPESGRRPRARRLPPARERRGPRRRPGPDRRAPVGGPAPPTLFGIVPAATWLRPLPSGRYFSRSPTLCFRGPQTSAAGPCTFPKVNRRRRKQNRLQKSYLFSVRLRP